MKIVRIAGVRANFMEIASITDAFCAHPDIEPLLVHTGQHYDQKTGDLFFREQGIPAPDINLEVGSGSHAVQTAKIMKAFEGACIAQKFDYVLVVGDVNSMIACGLVAIKLGSLVRSDAINSRERELPRFWQRTRGRNAVSTTSGESPILRMVVRQTESSKFSLGEIDSQMLNKKRYHILM